MSNFTGFKNGLFFIEGKQAGRLAFVGKEQISAYVSERRRSIHLMRKFDSWGIAEWILKWLQDHDVKLIVIREKERRETFSARIELYEQHGFNYHKPPFENQVMLQEKHFTKNGVQQAL